MRRAWQVARKLGVRRLAWRARHALRERFLTTPHAPLPWPDTHDAPTRERWIEGLGATHWLHQVAHWVSAGEAQRVHHQRLSSAQRGALEQEAARALDGEIRLYERDLFTQTGLSNAWSQQPGSTERWPMAGPREVWQASERCGDIKDVWEVGRCGWLWVMAEQRVCDGDTTRWSRGFSEVLRGFVAEHEVVGRGVQFLSAQECALRVLRWLLAAAVFWRDAGWSDDDFSLLCNMLRGHGQWIASQIDFARMAVPNNHVIAEALALYALSVSFPQWEEAAGWHALSRRVFFDEILEQFSADGGYCQGSHTYHRFALELMSVWWALASEDRALRVAIEQVCHRSGAHLGAWVMDETRGRLPNFGANDGAHLMIQGRRDYEDFRPVLDLMRGVSSRGTWRAYEARGSWELCWNWLAPHAPERTPKPWPRPQVMYGDANGLQGLRRGAWQVGMRVGEFWGTASQQDVMHVEVWRGGQEVAIDSGSHRYWPIASMTATSKLESHNILHIEKSRYGVQRVGRFTLVGELGETHGVSEDASRLWSMHHGWRGGVRGAQWRGVQVSERGVRVSDRVMLQGGETRAVLCWVMAGRGWEEVERSSQHVVWRDAGRGVSVRVALGEGFELEEVSAVACGVSRRYAAREEATRLEVKSSRGVGVVRLETELS